MANFTEPIGTIPRLAPFIEALARRGSDDRSLTPHHEGAIRDIIRRFVHLIAEQLGITDDCGLAPFADGPFTSHKTALTKIRARPPGSAMASRILGVEP